MKITILICTFIIGIINLFSERINKTLKIVATIVLMLVIGFCTFLDYNSQEIASRKREIKDSVNTANLMTQIKEKDEIISIQKTNINNYHYSKITNNNPKLPTVNDTKTYITRSIDSIQGITNTKIDSIILWRTHGFDPNFVKNVEEFLKSKSIKVNVDGISHGENLLTYGIYIRLVNKKTLEFSICRL